MGILLSLKVTCLVRDFDKILLFSHEYSIPSLLGENDSQALKTFYIRHMTFDLALVVVGVC